MNKKYYYILNLLLIFFIPSVIAGYFVLEHISIKHLIIFIILITVVGSIWDIWATKHGNKDPVWLWTFNHKDTLGIEFLGLPIEEYLFYIFSSVYIIFIWKSIELAIQTNNLLYYALVPALGLWTFISVLIFRKLGPKNDKILE